MFFQEATTFTTVLWDPSDETNPLFSFPANQPQDALFCSGHSFLSDGQLLCAGGGGGGPANVNRAWRFNPDTNIWTRTAGDMSFARWYPTVVTQGHDGGLGKGGAARAAAPVVG
ncbi:MAG: kelch repeat-containing protein [Gammaproteobacteria bacterium]